MKTQMVTVATVLYIALTAIWPASSVDAAEIIAVWTMDETKDADEIRAAHAGLVAPPHAVWPKKDETLSSRILRRAATMWSGRLKRSDRAQCLSEPM